MAESISILRGGRSGDGYCHCCECSNEQQPIYLEIDDEEFINQLNDRD